MDTVSGCNQQTLLLVALLYFPGSTMYAVIAFPNFSVHSVVLLQVLMAAVPMALLAHATLGSMKGFVAETGRRLAAAGIAGAALVTLQVAALAAWSGYGYFVNFSLERLAAGGGYHRDSVFHVSFIQRILATGRPSTGQHLDPVVPYHFLSYYFDAAVLRLLRLDAWESYALLFFGKSTLLLLSLLYFLVTLVGGLTRSFFWISSIIVTLAFTSGWGAIGSHSQWIPMTTLLLVSPWLRRVLLDDRLPSGRLAALTGLVVWLALGKLSIGLAFAALVGIWIVLTRGLTPRLAFLGVLWASLLAAWGLASGGSRLDPWGITVSRLLFRPAENRAVVSLVLLIVVLAALHRRSSSTDAGRIAIALGITLVLVLVVAAPFPSGSDFAYFAIGLFVVAMVTVLPAIFTSAAGSARTSSTLLLAALVAITPMTSASFLSPYGARNYEQFIRDANLVSFEWLNSGLQPSDRVSVLGSLRDPSLRAEQVRSRSSTEFHDLRDAIDSILAQYDLTKGNTSLFVPAEVFDQLEIDRYVAARERRDDYTGLLLTAVTGMSLVYGVRVGTTRNYGFHTYLSSSSDVFRRGLLTTPSEELCNFGRPIVILHDLDLLKLTIDCMG